MIHQSRPRRETAIYIFTGKENPETAPETRRSVRTIFAKPVREGKTMLFSSRRNSKTRVIAEVLAMIASARELAPHRLDAAADAEESLYESATEFCAALEQYAARKAQRRLHH